VKIMAQNLSGKLDIKGNVLLKYEGDDSVVEIPANVTRISAYAFYGCTKLKKVQTPVGLTFVGRGAFMGCNSLQEVIMPGWLYKQIDKENIFEDVKKVYFRFYASPQNFEIYKQNKTNDQAENKQTPTENTCENKEEEPAEIVKTADAEGLENSQIEVVISEEITEEEEDNLNVQEEVEEQDADADLDVFDCQTGVDNGETLKERIAAVTPVVVVKDIQIPKVKHDYKEYKDFIIENGVLIKYVGTERDVTIPEFVTEIGENAFSNLDVESVKISGVVTKIGAGAFNWCEHLKTINLPEGLLLIDDNAFADCGELEELIIPNGVKFIGASAFHACSGVKKLTLPNSLTSIGRRAFDFCVSLSEVKVPQAITILSDGAFSHCEGLRKVILPEGLVTISDWAFAECYSLEDIKLPESLKKIGDVAFMNCRSLVGLNLPQSVTEIGRQAYVGCSSLAAAFVPRHLENKIAPAKVFHKLKNLQIHFVDLT
jgi:hypothetical protein